MVRVCAFPSCTNRMSSNTPLSFHRLPLKSLDTLKLWLVVLQMDLKTPLRTLRLADHRVCSEHFDRDDYCQAKGRTSIPKHFFLKKNAVPRLKKRSAGKTQLQDSWAVMDGPHCQVRSTGTQVNIPETCSAATEKPAVQHIVDEEAILQLMKNCPMCNRKCRCSKRTRGLFLIVYQSCYFCHYQRKWASQPEARNMNTHKAHTPPKRTLQPKDKACV